MFRSPGASTHRSGRSGRSGYPGGLTVGYAATVTAPVAVCDARLLAARTLLPPYDKPPYDELPDDEGRQAELVRVVIQLRGRLSVGR
jgi:hypothetical protein